MKKYALLLGQLISAIALIWSVYLLLSFCTCDTAIEEKGRQAIGLIEPQLTGKQATETMTVRIETLYDLIRFGQIEDRHATREESKSGIALVLLLITGISLATAVNFIHRNDKHRG